MSGNQATDKCCSNKTECCSKPQETCCTRDAASCIDLNKLVGMSFDDAKALIAKHCSNANVVSVQQSSAVTMDHNTNRIRLVVDANNVVIEVPKWG